MSNNFNEIRERNERYGEQVRIALQARPNITTRTLSKVTGIDKRILNQILYYMPGAHKNEDRIPKWSWTQPVALRPRRRVIGSVALHDWFHAHPGFPPLPPLITRVVDGRTYVYLANENPDTAPCINNDIEARLRRDVIVEREVAEAAAEETTDPGVPQLECSSCGVNDELIDCSEGPLCLRCADDIDPASGKRRREL
jgi:hypothetical protein